MREARSPFHSHFVRDCRSGGRAGGRRHRGRHRVRRDRRGPARRPRDASWRRDRPGVVSRKPGRTAGFCSTRRRPGPYLVIVSRPGFSEAARVVVVTAADETLDVPVQLEVGVFSAEVSVTAARAPRETRQIPLHVDTITRAAIEQTNTLSTGDALTLAANITPVGNGPFGVRPRLRGLDSTRLLVLVDGERLNTARQATDRTGAEVGLISPDVISRMEIVNGAGTLLYGSDALAGTINIITNEPALSSDTRWLYGFNGFYSSNETRPARHRHHRRDDPALRRSPAGRSGVVRELPGRPLRRRGHAAAVRRRQTQTGRHHRRQLRLRLPRLSGSVQRALRPDQQRDSELEREGALRQRVESGEAGGESVAAHPLPAPADGRHRLPRFRAALLLQCDLAAAQQSRPRLGALRSAGGHAVAGECLAHGALSANRASAPEPAAGAVSGADAGRSSSRSTCSASTSCRRRNSASGRRASISRPSWCRCRTTC